MQEAIYVGWKKSFIHTADKTHALLQPSIREPKPDGGCTAQ
jgi:hypothetical protein